MQAVDPFEVIVSEHYEALFRFAMSLTHAEADAMDLTQQTFYIWASKGHQLRDPSKVKSWLYTTLHRTFLRARRGEIRFPHSELDETSPELPTFSPELANPMDSSQIVSALARIDAVYRPAVALFYLEDYSYREIAGILAVPVGTVKSRIARGLAQLKEIFLSGDTVPSGRGQETSRTLPATQPFATAPSANACLARSLDRTTKDIDP